MISIRCWTAADLALVSQLKSDAGWNQTEADLARFLALEREGCFAALWHGGAVGTAAAFLFGPVAWIAMVLVEKSMRGRGIGKALMQHALHWSLDRGASSVRLDATPLGRPLYEKLDFIPQFQVLRFAGQALATERRLPDGNESVRAEHLDAIAVLDQWATATDRRRLLQLLWEDQPETARVAIHNGETVGYLLARPGSHATQIGPGVANSADTGRRLLTDALNRLAGQPVYLDLPADNYPAVDAAQRYGLQVQRELTRMCHGRQVTENVSAYWASSGPEKG